MRVSKPSSAAEARSIGLKRYFTGKPCRHGHVADRFASSWACVECNKEKQKEKSASGRRKPRPLTQEQLELRRERKRELRKSPEEAAKIAEYGSRPEVRERRKARLLDPLVAEKERARNRLRKKEARATERGKAASRMHRAARRARLLMATPPWADKEKIASIYLDCPEGFQVDHLVPLRGVTEDGRLICGLHVHLNLRYLKKEDNMRRSNKMSQAEIEEVESLVARNS